MGVFVQAPFWTIGARRAPLPHVVSVVVTPPALEPLTLDEGKARAGLNWPDGDPRDDQMRGFIAAARQQVERDTGLALLTQTRDIYLDTIGGYALDLPSQARPLQSVTSVKWTDTAGAVNTFDPASYVVDLGDARIGLALGAVWPTDLRPFQPFVVRVVSGWTSPEVLLAQEPLLVHAVGLLTAHYATLGRDLASADRASEVPYGYAQAIEPYCRVTLP